MEIRKHLGKVGICPNCKTENKYTWIGGMSDRFVLIYDLDNNSLLSKFIYNKLSAFSDYQNFDDFINQQFKESYPIDCNKFFSLKNGLKCKNCKTEIISVNSQNLNARLNQHKSFILDKTIYYDLDEFMKYIIDVEVLK